MKMKKICGKCDKEMPSNEEAQRYLFPFNVRKDGQKYILALCTKCWDKFMNKGNKNATK